MFGKNAAGREYRDARNDLNRIAREDNKNGIHEETDRFVDANSRVAESAKSIPWWRR